MEIVEVYVHSNVRNIVQKLNISRMTVSNHVWNAEIIKEIYDEIKSFGQNQSLQYVDDERSRPIFEATRWLAMKSEWLKWKRSWKKAYSMVS